MTENTAYVYRLYLTDEQVVLFRKAFGCCRKVWNLMDRQAQYAATGKSMQPTPAKYKKSPYLRDVGPLALCNVQDGPDSRFQRSVRWSAGISKVPFA